MKPPILLFVAALIAGCTASDFKTPSGAEYSNRSFLWRRDAVDVHIKTNGEINVKILGSSSDADALKAVAAGASEGAVIGASKAFKP